MSAKRLRVPYLIAILCGCFVTLITSLFAFGVTDTLDRGVLNTLRKNTPTISENEKVYTLDIMRDITSLAGVGLVVLVLLITLTYLLLRRLWRAAIICLVLVVGTQLSVTSMKLFIARPRPDLVEHGAHVATHSFPSGHSAMGAAISLMVAWIVANRHAQKRVKAFAWIVGGLTMFAIGFSRAFLGVHWTSDVLAGWGVGATWACLCIGLAFTLQQRGAGIDRTMEKLLPDDSDTK